jgi:nitroreductase
MDVRLVIASRREVRDYAPTALPADVVQRILDAGRLAGSSQNRQPWTFVVPGPDARERLAESVYAPDNVRTCALAVAIVTERAFDAGRAAQNMMLVAWNDGVASCPNGIADEEAATRIVGAKPSIVLSFGYPQTPRDALARTPEEWSARAKRKPLDELVRWERW